MVILLQAGRDASYIADALLLTLSTVYFWIRRFTTEGPENNTYKKRGRPVGSGKMMTPENELLIQGLIASPNQPQDYGLHHSTWTRKAIAELIYNKLQLKIAERTLSDYLRSWGYSSQKPVKVAYQRDPEKVELWTNVTIKDIRDSAEKHNAVVFFGDESSFHTESFNGKSFSPIGCTPVITRL
jgi:transposase